MKIVLRRRHRPLRIGLTGSIAMGKSAVARFFRAAGVPVFDADAEVHRLQGPDGALLPAIEAAFPGTTGPNGVDRPRLGAIVFNDGAALKRLEAIVHPAVARSRRRFLRRHRSRPMVVFDIPLLFETRGERHLDLVVTVSARTWQQRVRACRRPGMTPGRLRAIRAKQTPDAIKRQRADIVIDTGSTLAQTRLQVLELVQSLRSVLF